MTKAKRTRALRYKKPALMTMGFDEIETELQEIQEACDDVVYFIGDEDQLLEAFDGDADEAWEFRMGFADLSAKCTQLSEALYEWGDRDDFNDCTVALIGNRYDLIGYDALEEDYFSLCEYDTELAFTEAGKRLMRKSKAEMISSIGQALGTLVAFLDLRQSYDYLKAAIDILRDENHSILQTVKQIEKAYEQEQENPYGREGRIFAQLTEMLPPRLWVE